jgi:hypothetical protein
VTRCCRKAREVEERKCANCGPEYRVSGDMRALLDFPYKLISYTKVPRRAVHVRADPREQRDLSKDAA